jgi:Fur family ferric uptake transcriptional regulator
MRTLKQRLAIPQESCRRWRNAVKTPVEAQCRARGVRLTGQRRLVARVLSQANDHPDFPELYRRVAKRNPRVSRATVYRTLKVFVSEGIIEQHAFRDGRSRYERASGGHHDHLIDLKTGKIFEFTDPQIELLQQQIARELGYRLVDHRLELYAVSLPRGAVGRTKHRRCRRPHD